jgi:hypothetical protein
MWRIRETRNSYKIFVRSREGKRARGRPSTWQGIIIGCGGVDWICVAYNKATWQAVVKTVMNLQVPYSACTSYTSTATADFRGSQSVCSITSLICSRVLFSFFCESPSSLDPPPPPPKLSVCLRTTWQCALLLKYWLQAQRGALGIAPRPRRYYSEDLYAHYRKHSFRFSFSFLSSFFHTYEPLSVFGTMTATCNAQDSCQDTQEICDAIVNVCYFCLRRNFALGLFVANANSLLWARWFLTELYVSPRGRQDCLCSSLKHSYHRI